MPKAPWWVVASVVACALASLWPLWQRHKAETANRAVGVLMEMSDVEAIAMASRATRAQALASLHEHGLTGVAITEDTIGSLVDSGTLRWTTDEGDPALELSYGPSDVLMTDVGGAIDLKNADRVTRALNAHGVRAVAVSGKFGTRIRVPRTTPMAMRAVPVGIDPLAASDAVSAGLVVVARHYNEFGSDPASIVATLRDSHKAGATAYLIGGDQALGNRNMLVATETALEELQMQYLSPEFVSLGGDAFLREKLAPQALRLHSVQQSEAETMSPAELEERFAKAYRERDVRWLLLRPPTRASEDLLKKTGETLLGIQAAIRGVGGEVKPPHPFTDPGVPRWVPGIVALLALPAVAWTALKAFGRSWLGWLCVVLAALAAAAGFTAGYKQFAALAVATAFPVLGYLLIAEREKPNPLRDYIVISLTSVVGGLVVGGMLTGIEYMLRVQEFPGVKMVLFGPVLVVGWLLLARQGLVRETLSKPVTWLAAAVTIVGLAVIAVMALRSGNDNPAAVSPMELQLRALLDNLLHVRPRTKEVAFGNPALVYALLLAAKRPDLKGWTSLLLLAGMVGQTSIVNTMCHLHTPVLLSLERIGIGLVLGGIIGLLVWLASRRWVTKMEATL